MSRKPVNMVGETYGRLSVVKDSGLRDTKGGVLWLCKCECGNTVNVRRGNLKNGSTESCGCLRDELRKARVEIYGTENRKNPKTCTIEGCDNDTSKGAFGYCGKHYARYKRHGDPLKKTSKEVASMNLRLSNQQSSPCKKDTYRKFYGEHEHRVVVKTIKGEEIPTGYHVHHKDGNKHNNHPDNLELLTAEEHAKLHADEKWH